MNKTSKLKLNLKQIVINARKKQNRREGCSEVSCTLDGQGDGIVRKTDGHIM